MSQRLKLKQNTPLSGFSNVRILALKTLGLNRFGSRINIIIGFGSRDKGETHDAFLNFLCPTHRNNIMQIPLRSNEGILNFDL